YKITKERKLYLDVLFKLNNVVEFVKLNNSIRINTNIIYKEKKDIIEMYNMFLKEFIYTAKFDQGIAIPDEFFVPLVRGIYTGYEFINIIGLVKFTKNHEHSKCDCCGRVRYFSEDFEIVNKKSIIVVDHHQVDEEILKLTSEELSTRPNLVYDRSIDLNGINPSLVDSSKFKIEF
ncbi:MAG: hypothetical protein ABI760_21860, partial [Ferruginibacter sp.]